MSIVFVRALRFEKSIVSRLATHHRASVEEASNIKHWMHDTTSRQASFASALFTSARLPILISQLFTGEQPSSGLLSLIWAGS